MTPFRTILPRPACHALRRLGGFAAIMLALAVPALQLKTTGGDNRGTPTGTNATDGLFVLERQIRLRRALDDLVDRVLAQQPVHPLGGRHLVQRDQRQRAGTVRRVQATHDRSKLREITGSPERYG